MPANGRWGRRPTGISRYPRCGGGAHPIGNAGTASPTSGTAVIGNGLRRRSRSRAPGRRPGAPAHPVRPRSRVISTEICRYASAPGVTPRSGPPRCGPCPHGPRHRDLPPDQSYGTGDLVPRPSESPTRLGLPLGFPKRARDDERRQLPPRARSVTPGASAGAPRAVVLLRSGSLTRRTWWMVVEFRFGARTPATSQRPSAGSCTRAVAAG